MAPKNNISARGDNSQAAGESIYNIETNVAVPSPVTIFDPQKLADIINAIDASLLLDETAQLNDFVRPNIEEKNRLNGISDTFFSEGIKENYEYFAAIEAFFKDPTNKKFADKYKHILADVRNKIIARSNMGESMENIIATLFDFAQQTVENRKLFNENSWLVNILSCFMYVNCDIGRKAE